ncbi:peptidoglycan DD-metalloendopeptidase family protein [Urechidicola croceus]|uniref:Peptidase M23 n=1 Tax=Urechidicola croceus TaxID=1850246 RepID=A0A1D8PB87_9FLAO|nr:peptidoglycan DD-metalloendopeptidase family protein [Urechidicola croceus]AOW21842.1 peptidase M23 [Urechidicola croceus]
MTSKDVCTLLSKISEDSIKILDNSILSTEYIKIDLSELNQELKKIDISSSNSLSKYIDSYLSKGKAKVAYGGYLEKRNLYNRSKHFSKANEEDKRNIHLGLDFWANEGTLVIVPFNGEIHSFNNNTNYGDYGPTIVLKHYFEKIVFYTLYGHLSLKSILNLKVGTKLKQGDVLGYLGSSYENGDYPPHLHFQIILDLQNYCGDYPGVSNINDLSFYKDNCPDPNCVLRIY